MSAELNLEPSRRIQVELEAPGGEQHAKIRVESYDPVLGWYTSGSLAVPLAQLPLLEQALSEMRALEAEPCRIIPFPGPAGIQTAAELAVSPG
jgi:hypothetical protein